MPKHKKELKIGSPEWCKAIEETLNNNKQSKLTLEEKHLFEQYALIEKQNKEKGFTLP